jgi:hypothetical protein
MKSGIIKTDVYYKETNTHDYLHYTSHHPSHVKNNIPYVFAKHIVHFTSDSEMVQKNMMNLEGWLLNCGYPLSIIKKGIHNSQLQGPAPPPSETKIIPFISTYFSNLDNSHALETTKSLITNSKNHRVQEVFKDVKFVQALRQPPNLLRRLTRSTFVSPEKTQLIKDLNTSGIFTCNRSNCKVCKLYLQKCSSFITANGTIWEVRSHVTCHSKNAIYYQVCNFCKKVSDIGKTVNLRDRTNNHIYNCRHGGSGDTFDDHVFTCSRTMNLPHTEPFFQLFVFMVLSDYNKLRNYERKLHLQGHDTINSPHS